VWNLIVKDLKLMRSTLFFYLVLVAAFPLLFGRTEQGAVVVGTWSFLLPYMVVGRLCYQEELNRGLAFLRSLPLRPAAIVWSKFLGMLLLLGIFLLALIAAAVLGGVRVSLPPEMNISPAGLLLFPLGFALVLSGVMMLAFFLWDYRRASYVYFLLLLGLLPVAFPAQVLPVVKAAVESLARSPQLYLGGFALAALALYLFLGYLSALALGRRDIG